MIDTNEYPILKNNLSTLKETSIDNHNKKVTEAEFMTESQIKVINFDDVKKDYIKLLHLSDTPQSNDALYINSKEYAIFIEFKNGYVLGKEKFSIRKKIYDSMLILTDIIGKGISYTREHLDYILVYNKDKNTEEDNSKTKYSKSESRDKIDRTLLGYGNDSFIECGVEIFKGYCFKDVHTYTQEEFESLFVNKYSHI